MQAERESKIREGRDREGASYPPFMEFIPQVGVDNRRLSKAEGMLLVADLSEID